MKGNTILAVEGICKVESDPYKAKIIVFKYSLEKHRYFSNSIKIDRVHIPMLIKLLEVANDSGQI
jgi:hypothetical protein